MYQGASQNEFKNWNIKLICSGMGQLLTLIGYSSEFSDMVEADKLHLSYNIPHNNRLNPDTVSAFGGR